MAVSCWVSPDGRFAAGGVTTTSSTAGRTVIAAVPDSVADASCAVIVASPVLPRGHQTLRRDRSGRGGGGRPGDLIGQVPGRPVGIDTGSCELLGLPRGACSRPGARP